MAVLLISCKKRNIYIVRSDFTRIMVSEFRKNVRTSFARVSGDVDNLSQWVNYLKYEIDLLKQEKCACNKPSTAVVSSKKAKKFHAESCVFVRNIKPQNKKAFASVNAALIDGLQPCACTV
jgi:L-ribulose-5-phosphate 3-epimerase UlaE